ncbi:hypothetical protein HPB47_012705, partial [Ixodes persulcatus]
MPRTTSNTGEVARPPAARVAVIGAGASGLTAVKACLEEDLDVVCYERSDVLGGLWHYTDKVETGRACVMRSTVINSSKEMSAFSDFPPDPSLPNYMHNSLMAGYIEQYGRSSGAAERVLLLHEVTDLRQGAGDKWALRVRDLASGLETSELVDAVMLCTGHHAHPLRPRFAGLDDEFRGRVLHSQEYRTPRGFEDRRVLVVGVGNSAGDLAVELASVARQVWLSTRRGSWVIGRVGPRGQPFDACYQTRLLNVLFHWLPYWLVCLACERAVEQRFDHGAYQLRPKHRIFGQHPMVNDALPNRILSGTVRVKGPVKRFTADGALFEGESEPVPLDDVILATGYRVIFPFLAPGVLDVGEDNQVDVYKLVFPPDRPGLALIGLAQPIGALLPISELQSRWAARVFAGKASLPPVGDMWRQVRRYQDACRQRYYQGPRHTLQRLNDVALSQLAIEIDAKPSLVETAWSDPRLAVRMLFGPSLPYQYRLRGPHPWLGARDAILNYDQRVRQALCTSGALEQRHVLIKPSLDMILIVALVMLLFSWLL